MRKLHQLKQYIFTKVYQLLSAIQRALIIIVGFVAVSSIAFGIIWFLMLILHPNPPHFSSTPNLKVKSTDNQSLLAFYINLALKQEICTQQSKIQNLQKALSSIGLTFAEYCNINHEEFPSTYKPVDIKIIGLASTHVEHMEGCLFKIGQDNQLACQKFRAAEQVQIFKDLRLNEILYFSISIYSKPNLINEILVKVNFDEKINRIEWLIKKFYTVISLFLSVSMGLGCGVAFLIWQASNILRERQVDRKEHWL